MPSDYRTHFAFLKIRKRWKIFLKRHEIALGALCLRVTWLTLRPLYSRSCPYAHFRISHGKTAVLLHRHALLEQGYKTQRRIKQSVSTFSPSASDTFLSKEKFNRTAVWPLRPQESKSVREVSSWEGQVPCVRKRSPGPGTLHQFMALKRDTDSFLYCPGSAWALRNNGVFPTSTRGPHSEKLISPFLLAEQVKVIRFVP